MRQASWNQNMAEISITTAEAVKLYNLCNIGEVGLEERGRAKQDR
jgi:hypothetical protein